MDSSWVCPLPEGGEPTWEVDGTSVAAACVASGLAQIMSQSELRGESAVADFFDQTESESWLSELVEGGRHFGARSGWCK